MDQRKLMDNANTITDMAKVGTEILSYPISAYLRTYYKYLLTIITENFKIELSRAYEIL